MASYILKKRPYLEKVKKRSRIVQTFGAWQPLGKFETLRAAGIAQQKITGTWDQQIFFRGKPVNTNAVYQAIRSLEK
jgi:hypothetical protein